MCRCRPLSGFAVPEDATDWLVNSWGAPHVNLQGRDAFVRNWQNVLLGRNDDRRIHGDDGRSLDSGCGSGTGLTTRGRWAKSEIDLAHRLPRMGNRMNAMSVKTQSHAHAGGRWVNRAPVGF